MTRTLRNDDIIWGRGFLDPAHVRHNATAVRETGPTRAVWRGAGDPRPLPSAPIDLSDISLAWTHGRTVPLATALAESETDALLVMHRGRKVYETYLHGYRAHEPHLNASAAKSYLGLLAALLEDQGLLNRDSPVAHYVPEFAGTGYGDATIDQLLHMSTDVRFGNRPYDRVLEAHRYWAVVTPSLRPQGYRGPTTILDHLATARAAGPYGREFRYENGNVEALAEVLRRITGISTAELFSTLLWSKIGTAEDGCYLLDSAGTEMACGGFAATASDVARLGEMLRCGGAVGDRQIVPARVVDAIGRVSSGPAARVRLPRDSADAPASLSYRDFWWVLNDGYGSYMASGIHGQRLFISPGTDLVIVHYGAHILSPSAPQPPLAGLFAQIAAVLMGSATRN
ncbi:serine hydrolase domain-containing protein [Nocardia goodfellowii]|uniref:CubicO group peptidase (Beta-lactamase class C family) n=1 Tax=Nocardia goodfellowii TaxID=882446 RepID=A0ABS4QL57_9NOCA|nr:serine hydrolase [Nocardia goodfellowii]MBP2192435.1 CubicO group peptidase (beta-lactamase class C family) [Nocardia goodfellowii]